MKEFIGEIAGYVLAVIVTIVAWFSHRDLGPRIGQLERDSVTHEQLGELMKENREERASLHAENSERLQRIEDKIDSNKTDAADSHKELRDELHALALEVAAK